LLAKHQFTDGPDDDAAYNEATLPSISFLPMKLHVIDTDTVIIVRNVKKHEDRLTFDLINRTKNLGEGIAVHDPPNLAFFRRSVLLGGPCIVFEDSLNGAVIGFTSVCPSWFMRSPQANGMEATIIIDKQYQVFILTLSNIVSIEVILYVC
jgi:hypothetical protein